MKMVMTILSAVGLALMMAFNEYSPIAELNGIMASKRRFALSLGLYAAAFFLVIAAIVTGVIEGALQYEVQGFILWSAMYTAAAIFVGLAVLSLIAARLLRPRAVAPAFSFAKLEEKFHISELLENWMKQSSASTQSPNPVPTAPPPPEPKAPYASEHYASATAHH